jgi:hypothetical protein
MPEEELPNLMRTLLAAGFDVVRVDRKPNYIAFTLERPDEFGIGIKYLLAYAGDGVMSDADIEGLKKPAVSESSSLVIVSGNTNIPTDGAVVITKARFFGLVGGVVSSVLPLEPDYGAQLTVLAKNKLPTGLTGDPDDLFEAYVHAGLQFLLRGRVLRYGQNRRFEAVPDGLALIKGAPLILYDAKAAKDPYELSKTAIRQFSDYITQFHNRYEEHVRRVHAFAVVSGSFQERNVLLERSNELYAACHVPLVCVTAESIAQMVGVFADRPVFRSIVDWNNIFAAPVLDFAKVKEVVDARKRDEVVRD